MIYLDSSALVKKYVKENGSEHVLGIVDKGEIMATSKLAYPEIYASLGRKRREKALTQKDYHSAVGDFESDWREFLIIEFQDELLPLMKQLVWKHSLKGADLVHLSSAIWIRKAAREKVVLVASDIQLLRAAKAEKIEIFNPEA